MNKAVNGINISQLHNFSTNQHVKKEKNMNDARNRIQSIEKASRFLELGADAIKGIGALLQPEHADEQLNFAH